MTRYRYPLMSHQSFVFQEIVLPIRVVFDTFRNPEARGGLEMIPLACLETYPTGVFYSRSRSPEDGNYGSFDWHVPICRLRSYGISRKKEKKRVCGVLSCLGSGFEIVWWYVFCSTAVDHGAVP